MRWRKEKSESVLDPETARIVETMIRRVDALPTSDLYSWAETAVSAFGRHMLRYQRHGDSADIAEAELAARAMDAIVLELKRRSLLKMP